MQIPKKLATNVLAVASLTAMPVILAGCGASDPSVEEVTNRFQSMVQVKGEPDGETTVEVESAGTIWALVRRDDVITVSPSQCHIDGQPMGDATRGPQHSRTGRRERYRKEADVVRLCFLAGRKRRKLHRQLRAGRSCSPIPCRAAGLEAPDEGHRTVRHVSGYPHTNIQRGVTHGTVRFHAQAPR